MLIHEWKTRLTRPATLLCLAVYGALLIYAAYSGHLARNGRTAAIANHQNKTAASMNSWLKDLVALEEKGAASGVRPWAGSPMDVHIHTALKPAPLADFAIGQSDFLPFFGTVSLWDPDIRLFSKYEFEDPVALALGAFDFSKAVIFILPLLLIVLCFDGLSAERDNGRLGLILAQGGSIQRIFWWRLLIRGGLVLCLTVLISLLACLVGSGQASMVNRLPYYGAWCLCTLLYGTFWLAVIGFVAGKNRTSTINITLLLLSWTAFTLIIPASAVAITGTMVPMPSRLAYLTQAREVENQTQLAQAAIANQYLLDHPETLLNEASSIPDYVRTAFFVTTQVDEATRPILLDFEKAARTRDRMLRGLHYLSPAMAVHHFFNTICGTGSARHHRYWQAARALKAAYAAKTAPLITAGHRLPSSEINNLPAFNFQDPPLYKELRQGAGRLGFMAVAVMALFAAAARRLRIYLGPHH